MLIFIIYYVIVSGHILENRIKMMNQNNQEDLLQDSSLHHVEEPNFPFHAFLHRLTRVMALLELRHVERESDILWQTSVTIWHQNHSIHHHEFPILRLCCCHAYYSKIDFFYEGSLLQIRVSFLEKIKPSYWPSIFPLFWQYFCSESEQPDRNRVNVGNKT